MNSFIAIIWHFFSDKVNTNHIDSCSNKAHLDEQGNGLDTIKVSLVFLINGNTIAILDGFFHHAPHDVVGLSLSVVI